MSFGTYLRDLRRSRCVSLANALDALGNGPHAVTEFLDLETGLRLPRIDELHRLAAFFGVSETELLRRAGYVGAVPRAEIPQEGAD